MFTYNVIIWTQTNYAKQYCLLIKRTPITIFKFFPSFWELPSFYFWWCEKVQIYTNFVLLWKGQLGWIDASFFPVKVDYFYHGHQEFSSASFFLYCDLFGIELKVRVPTFYKNPWLLCWHFAFDQWLLQWKPDKCQNICVWMKFYFTCSELDF